MILHGLKERRRPPLWKKKTQQWLVEKEGRSGYATLLNPRLHANLDSREMPSMRSDGVRTIPLNYFPTHKKIRPTIFLLLKDLYSIMLRAFVSRALGRR